MDRSFVRFAMVGLANTAVGYSAILLLHYGFGVGPTLANVGGYMIGALLSYALNRSFTFASDRPHVEALPRFAVTVAICFVLNLLVLKLGLSVLLLPLPLAQALAMASFTIAFYAANRFLVFRS